MGFGAGVIAKMAYSPTQDQDLVLRDISHLFPVSVTRVAWAKNKYLRAYHSDLVSLLLEYGEGKDGYA